MANLERLFYRILTINFEKHPMVKDLETNPGIGLGLGMARTTDPLLTLYILLKIKSKLGNKNLKVMDVGCGDGVVLRIMKFARFKEIIGIEGDFQLYSLAKRNNQYATIYFEDFIKKTCVKLIKDINPDVIFLFNPTTPKILLKFLEELKLQNIVILRNPKVLPWIRNSNLTFSEIMQFENYVVLQFT